MDNNRNAGHAPRESGAGGRGDAGGDNWRARNHAQDLNEGPAEGFAGGRNTNQQRRGAGSQQGHAPRESGAGGSRGDAGSDNWRARNHAQDLNEGPAEGFAGGRNTNQQRRGAGIQQGFNREENRQHQSSRPWRRQEQRRNHSEGNMGRNYQPFNRQVDSDRKNENHQQNRIDQCMELSALKEIAHCDNQDVIAKVYEKQASFLKLLATDIDKKDIYFLIMKVISKVCISTFDELKLKLLLDICNSRFVVNFRNYITDLPYANVKARNSLYWNNQSEFWSNFVAFCQCIVDISPTTALLKCRPLIDSSSRLCLELLKEKHGFVLSEEYTKQLQQLRERLTFCEKEETRKEEKRQARNMNLYDYDEHMIPPENFRNLSVLPSRDDLLNNQPFLRPNIVNGGYQDTEHYLDVQFRLLREDCFGPLREGISQFIEDPNKKKYDNIRIYHNVKFIAPFISKYKFGDMVQLDEKATKYLKKIDWAQSKRFIFGSLLLFTKDNCKSFITATILDREVKFLKHGMIPVAIVDKVPDNDNACYIMIESEVYFEPYFHVLKALQDPKFPKHIAMSKYIVRVDPVPNPPAYLTPDSVFFVEKGLFSDTTFSVLNPLTWPTKDDLGFNDTQYEAYKLALTHEFAVIQGPPGTGKTFLAVKVAKTLLENIPSSKCLMLVICYTNHALDQFLENIMSVANSIARIGGQSRNEKMEEINLNFLRKNTKLDKHTKRWFFGQRECLTYLVKELKRTQELLDTLNKGVISFKSLKDNPEVQSLGQYYAQYRADVKRDPLKHWLFEDMNYLDFDDIMGNENLVEQNNEEVIVENSDEEEENIELILDEFEDELEYYFHYDFNDKMSFSLKNIEYRLKNYVLNYQKSNERQQILERKIVVLKSQVNLYNEMSNNRTRNTQVQVTNNNAGEVPIEDRWALYFKWASPVINTVKGDLIRIQKSLDFATIAYEEARMIMDLKILKGIQVIGMTTSGAARLRKLLQALAPPIVIVEEAAEVLEQHIVTSLTKGCQHLILIGDHQQLRPSAADIKLARHYNMEISLFERMITNGIHSRRLGVQHRMRPEIAALISPHIYPDLRNHSSVESFPNVRGVAENLFFLTHNYKEKEVNDSASKSNESEADVTLALANYLMQQGYEPGDITILAAYAGQMFYMKKQREKYAFLQKVKITVVDNYQGEESKIILLSLVRNNNQNKIGFLGTENRVCVALSRAREGFYIFGNIDILKRNSVLWNNIATTLKDKGLLGTSLTLKCENHPEHTTMISSPKDFEKVPEGGCLLKCNYNLSCGHGCMLACHGYDSGHDYVQCCLPCERVLCELGHVCPLICADKCEPCRSLVKKELPCGHKKLVFCHKEPNDPSVKCDTIVSAKLPKCGHEVDKQCHLKVEEMKCPVRCVHRVDKCGHECLLTCHVDHDPNHESYVCENPCARAKKGCTADLMGDRENHQCTKKCHEPCDDCTVEVTKKRSKCKHSDRVPCNENVDDTLCRKNCARVIASCNHFCKNKCFEACGDCNQKVKKIIPDCNHEVTVLCKIPATRDLCRNKCERKLPCGHTCTEQCSKICDPKMCTQLSKIKLASPCGHQVMLPCNIYSAWDGNVEILLKYCTEPCGETLNCEHLCGGTCGSCLQGRLHLTCQKKCERTQLCGHICKEPCSRVCPPCNEICGRRCPHSQCGKICGAPCKPCQEKCTRMCRHGACSRLCGEPCRRPACAEACLLRLRCGHRCRGLCGERCPNICNVCRPELFPRDFLSDEDVKFICLQDCTHHLDIEYMDNLMMGDKDKISIRTCPQCRAPIINTQRYKDLDLTFRTEINLIKERVFGNEEIIQQKREELFLKVGELNSKYEDILNGNPEINAAITELSDIVKTQKKVSLPKLETLFQGLEILDIIAECQQKYQAIAIRTLEDDFINLIKLLCTTLTTNKHKITQQLQQDIGNELKRMNAIIQLEKIFHHILGKSSNELPEVKQAAEAARKIVMSWNKFEHSKTVTLLKELEETVQVSGIVTQEETNLIVKAIGLKAGSWYKCPNGHYFSIGECEGVMEESKCPDCGAVIEGRNHSLLSTNAHDGEIDGCTVAAQPI